MKKILFISIGYLLFLTANAQSGKRFDFKPTKFGTYQVTSVSDQVKGEGNRGQAFWLDDSYASGLFYDIIKEVLSKEKLQTMHLNSGYNITFNSNGEILKCIFLIDTMDMKIITEEDLNNLYLNFKKLKIDMTKVRIEALNYPSEVKVFDYTEVFGSLIPPDYRVKNLNKK
jgi:hypothetical protein